MSETDDWRFTTNVSECGYWELSLAEYTLIVGEYDEASDGTVMCMPASRGDTRRFAVDIVTATGAHLARSQTAHGSLKDAKLAAMFEVRERLDNSMMVLHHLIKMTRNW